MKKIIIKLISALFPTKNLRKKIRTKLNSKFNNTKLSGCNNKIILTSSNGEKEVHSIKGLAITINGNNNVIRIPQNHNFTGSINIQTDNCLIDIKSTNFLNLNINTYDSSGQKLVIEPNTTIFGATIFLNEKDASVIIGKNCLFSGNIVIWATDGHAIFDEKSKNILNHIKHPVIIEDSCWIGYGTIMTKNAYLSSNSVVGAGSVITKKFEKKNVVIAGNPAKIIKTDTDWNALTAAKLEETRSKDNNKS